MSEAVFFQNRSKSANWRAGPMWRMARLASPDTSLRVPASGTTRMHSTAIPSGTMRATPC